VTDRMDVPGKTLCIDCSFRPIYNTEGEVSGAACVARDVTDDIEKMDFIEKQNKKLKEIAWMQSHKMRSPVASLKGLLQLWDKKDPGSAENAALLGYMETALDNIDKIIHEIDACTRISPKVCDEEQVCVKRA
jgi:signal transduction histidine kinase